MNHKRNFDKEGFALVTALLLVVVLAVMATIYFSLTKVELTTTSAAAASSKGFYAAEAGLNLRGKTLKEEFEGYERPDGTSPTTEDATAEPCSPNNEGSGDFKCDSSLTIEDRQVRTYVVEKTCIDEDGDGECDIEDGELLPDSYSIGTGDNFAGLNVQEYKYSAFSDAFNQQGDLESRLEMVFRSRLVPLFQFAAFFKDDLEIGNGPPMTLNGRVHTNSSIYFASQNTLTIGGKVTATGNIYRGRKPGDSQVSESSCVGEINIPDANGEHQNLDAATNSCTATGISTEDLETTWGGRVQQQVATLEIPDVGILSRGADSEYWGEADLRIVLNLNNSPPTAEVRNLDDDNMSNVTSFLNSNCEDATDYSDVFYNNREQVFIEMLEVDMKKLLTCLGNTGLVNLDDSSEGGLVFHFSVDGPDSDGINNYGVRIRNGETLASSNGSHAQIRGLTVVTDQALYVQGHYNRINKKPAAFLADSLNVLSGNWCDVWITNFRRCIGQVNTSFDSTDRSVYMNSNFQNKYTNAELSNAFRLNNLGKYDCTDENDAACINRNLEATSADSEIDGAERDPVDTTINAAMLAGVDLTSDPSNPVRDRNNELKRANGGLHNYPRMHERWKFSNTNYKRLSIRGSFVSLGEPKHVNGAFSSTGQDYKPPERDWDYDTDFNTASNLPPLSPRFVYLVQEVFLRDFEQ